MPDSAGHRHPSQERSDVRVRTITLTAAAVLAALVLLATGIKVLLRIYGAPQRSFAVQAGKPAALRSDPAAERQAFESEKDRELHAYARLDGDREHVRIPIERAMDIMTEPQREAAP